MTAAKVVPGDACDSKSESESDDPLGELYRRSIDCPWYMLSPDGRGRACIDFSFAVLVFVELVVLPVRIAYNVAFSDFSAAWRIYDWTMFVLFNMDTASNFLTGYVDFGNTVFDPARTASRYLRIWGPLDVVASTVRLGMALDMFSELPGLVGKYGLSGREIAVFCLFRLFRLPTVSRRLQQYFASMHNVDYESAAAIRKLLILTVTFFGFVHIFACWMLWIAEVALDEEERRHGNWIEVLKKSEPSVEIPEHEFSLWTYLAALHFSVACVVGNDTTVQVYLPREMAFTIFVHVVAFLITAFFTASVVSFFQSIVRRKHEFAVRDVIFQDFFRMHDAPVGLRLRVQRFLFHKCVERRFLAADDVVKELPQTLRADILLVIRAGYFRKHPFFCGLSESAMSYICLEARDYFFMDGDILLERDAVGDSTFFLTRGSVSVIRTMEEGGSFQVSAPGILGSSCIFQTDEKQAVHYSATAKALAPVATIVILRSVVLEAVRSYPKNKAFYEEWCDLMSDPSNGMPEFTEFHGEPFAVRAKSTGDRVEISPAAKAVFRRSISSIL
jgi:hypothetical protein